MISEKTALLPVNQQPVIIIQKRSSGCNLWVWIMLLLGLGYWAQHQHCQKTQTMYPLPKLEPIDEVHQSYKNNFKDVIVEAQGFGSLVVDWRTNASLENVQVDYIIYSNDPQALDYTTVTVSVVNQQWVVKSVTPNKTIEWPGHDQARVEIKMNVTVPKTLALETLKSNMTVGALDWMDTPIQIIQSEFRVGSFGGSLKGFSQLNVTTDVGSVHAELFPASQSTVLLASKVGSVQVKSVGYQGAFLESTKVGSLQVHGTLVKILKKSNGWFNRFQSGVVGEPNGNTFDVTTKTGSISLNFE